MKAGETKIVAGLEVGSSKVLIVIGQIFPDGIINIIGTGETEAKGVDKGKVIDLNALVESIRIAVRKAEDMADCEIRNVLLAVSGQSIQCQNESGMCIVGSAEITEYHIEEALYTAKSIKLNDDIQLLHAIPQDYVIDGRADVKNPKGLSAGRLSAHVHLITCNSDEVKNLIKAVEQTGLMVEQLVFSGLASSYAVVTEEEKELGVCLVDFGAGTMEISLYTDSYLRYSMVIPYGGNLITHDIARGLSISKQDSELIKLKYGTVLETDVLKNETISIPSLGGREDRIIDKGLLAQIIEARYVELFQHLNTKINEMQNDLRAKKINSDIGAGLILTGGAAEINGVIECAQQELDMSVRIGAPKNIEGLTDYVDSPTTSTAVGLLHYYHFQKDLFTSDARKKKSNFLLRGMKKIWGFINNEL